MPLYALFENRQCWCIATPGMMVLSKLIWWLFDRCSIGSLRWAWPTSSRLRGIGSNGWARQCWGATARWRSVVCSLID